MTVQPVPQPSTLCTFPDGTERPPPSAPHDGRRIVLFDIDNTLYSKEAGVAELMKDKIRAYFLSLGLTEAEAKDLHLHYYKEYGLAIRGLVRHHQVDPLDYDRCCDSALPLDEVLRPDPKLRKLLHDIDREKCQVWALTNAYKIHATRVLKLLGIADQFEGVISCNYGAGEFSCKPEAAFFNEAIAHISSPPPPVSSLYFVDDSALNIRGSHALHWGHSVLYDEGGSEEVRLGGLDKMPLSPARENGDANGPRQGREEEGPRVSVVHQLDELRSVWREIFTS
ncbi:uncharacterized protein JCM10292_001702 [Rhodotorula paludigena]|uniref:uncharacterized protein n=1 Tax=Rhodotorula paludigena TaxID=86838 RepID=UPI00317C0BF6